MQVIATARGYDNHSIREPGEQFEMNIDPALFELPEGKGRPTWLMPVGGYPKPKAAKPGKPEKAPATLAEAAQEQAGSVVQGAQDLA